MSDLGELRDLAARWCRFDASVAGAGPVIRIQLSDVLSDEEALRLFETMRKATAGYALQDRLMAAHGIARMLDISLDDALKLCKAAGCWK